MSLLDSDNDDDSYADEDQLYADEDQPVWRSHTDDPLFSGPPPQKGKSKKSERKAKGEDRKGQSKPMHWTKQKENVVQEKTPKKSKGQSVNKPTISWTPPGSPKTVRPEGKGKTGLAEGKGSKGAVNTGGAGQLQPSPNVKSHRKRYSQLGAESSSGEEGEEGFLLSNKPALRTEEAAATDSFPMMNPLDRPSNPFLVEPLVPGDSSLFSSQGPSLGTTQQGPGTMLGTMGTGASIFTSQQQQQQQAWDPTPSLSAHAFQTTVGLGGGATNPLGLGGGATNPLLGMDSGPTIQTNPFLADTAADSAFAQPAFNFPPPPTSAPPLSTLSLHPDPQEAMPSTSAPPPEGVADWSISQELCQKCTQQFQELEPVNGRLPGDKAKEFFIRSKLPSQELSAIW